MAKIPDIQYTISVDPASAAAVGTSISNHLTTYSSSSTGTILAPPGPDYEDLYHKAMVTVNAFMEIEDGEPAPDEFWDDAASLIYEWEQILAI